MKKAFTLIELLVVVLIIGILAAIALPQYRLAVEKSKIAEATVMLKSMQDACTRYYLENPSGYCTFDTMDISFTDRDNNIASGENFFSKNFFYNMDIGGDSLCASSAKSMEEWVDVYDYDICFDKPYGYETPVRYCIGGTNFGDKVCKSLSGGKTLSQYEFGYEF